MVGFTCSAWVIGLNYAVILSLRQCHNSRYLIFIRLYHQRINMSHSSRPYGGSTVQVGRLYVPTSTPLSTEKYEMKYEGTLFLLKISVTFLLHHSSNKC